MIISFGLYSLNEKLSNCSSQEFCGCQSLCDLYLIFGIYLVALQLAIMPYEHQLKLGHKFFMSTHHTG